MPALGYARNKAGGLSDMRDRGDHQKAADCYRKVIDFIRAHPEDYDPEYEATFRNLVNRLDPSAAI